MVELSPLIHPSSRTCGSLEFEVDFKICPIFCFLPGLIFLFFVAVVKKLVLKSGQATLTSRVE